MSEQQRLSVVLTYVDATPPRDTQPAAFDIAEGTVTPRPSQEFIALKHDLEVLLGCAPSSCAASCTPSASAAASATRRRGSGCGGSCLLPDGAPIGEADVLAVADEGSAAVAMTPRSAADCATAEQLLQLGADADWAAGSEAQRVSEITPYLAVGCFPDAATLARLADAGYTHFVNCCADERQYRPCDVPAAAAVALFPIQDREDSFVLLHHFDDFAAVVDAARARGGRAFVHCAAGINRSVTLVTAYLMHRERMSVLDAVAHLRRSGRRRMLENAGFRAELIDFDLRRRNAPRWR